MTGFCSSNSIGIICLNSFNELIFINSYGIIVITVIINHSSNIYITFAIICYGSNGIGSGNVFQLLVYPALRSNTVYAVGVNSASIIDNLGSQLAICKGQCIINNFGISINNTDFNLCTIFTYQFIGINCCVLTGSCLYIFNNLIFQACLTCFTVNGLRHGDIIGVK